mmetsp:Transcript_45736/g.97246  ORF Transcript_45736/g.97246 Transcript_45736/m.97246 type:complete len:168 (+) Transcript_45736:242-745(+)
MSSAVATTQEPPAGFNRAKRRWARGFLWATSALLLLDKPLLSLSTSACAVYAMHGGKWLSHKNFKWMSASVISFAVSLYAVAMWTESEFVDEDRAYELKATLAMKHRAAEIVWGGMLLMALCLTIKEKIDRAATATAEAVAATAEAVEKVSRALAEDGNGKAKIKSG